MQWTSGQGGRAVEARGCGWISRLLGQSGLREVFVGAGQGLTASPTAAFVVLAALLGYREPRLVRIVLLIIGVVAGVAVAALRRRRGGRSARLLVRE